MPATEASATTVLAASPPATAGVPVQTPTTGSPLNVATLLPQIQSQSAEPVTETADLPALPTLHNLSSRPHNVSSRVKLYHLCCR